jgi:hypothetical protein
MGYSRAISFSGSGSFRCQRILWECAQLLIYESLTNYFNTRSSSVPSWRKSDICTNNPSRSRWQSEAIWRLWWRPVESYFQGQLSVPSERYITIAGLVLTLGRYPGRESSGCEGKFIKMTILMDEEYLPRETCKELRFGPQYLTSCQTILGPRLDSKLFCTQERAEHI